MKNLRSWMGRLEEELSRELGQAVSLAAAAEAASPSSLNHTLTGPDGQLLLAADGKEVGAFLVEARVLEAAQADPETVSELWFGILASVASAWGGKASASGASPGGAESWILRLGQAEARLAVVFEAGLSERGSRSEDQGDAGKPPALHGASGAGAPASPAARAGNFDLLLEVELDAAVRFGSRELELKELLELGPGDVVELDRQVADPVDLIVGDRIVARGEVVLVNGNFGLRVTEVAEPVRRLESIRCLW
jgi:flagellar motor switch protein FliN